jgi:hypothetical protein
MCLSQSPANKLQQFILDQYISQGKVAEKYFDAGSLPLEAKYPGQGRDCIHFTGIKARGKFAKNSTVPDN